MIGSRTPQADALHAAGDRKSAEDEFRAAERRQRRHRSNSRFCTRLAGYWYCDLLLSQGRARGARSGQHRSSICAAEPLGCLTSRSIQSNAWPRPSRLSTAEPWQTRVSAEPADVDAQGPRPSRRGRSKPARLRADMRICRAACSPAPHSAAPSASGTAPKATSMRQKRSPNREKCDCIGAIARSKARGLRWRGARPSRRSTASSSRARRRPSCLTPTLRRR